MGCCHLFQARAVSGLIVPEPELALNEAEWQHPFHQIPVSELLNAFECPHTTVVLTKAQFLNLCQGLDFREKQLHALECLARVLTTPMGSVDRFKLLGCCVLLGKGSFREKFKGFQRIYSKCSAVELTRMMFHLVDISIRILPKLSALNNITKLYLSKLACVETVMVTRFVQKLTRKNSGTWADVEKVLEKEPVLQKFCWANGIRMMLLEEDLSISAVVHLTRKEDPQCQNLLRVIGAQSNESTADRGVKERGVV